MEARTGAVLAVSVLARLRRDDGVSIMAGPPVPGSQLAAVLTAGASVLALSYIRYFQSFSQLFAFSGLLFFGKHG